MTLFKEECVECDEEFLPKVVGDMFCEKCSEKYQQCGCAVGESCLCYTR